MAAGVAVVIVGDAEQPRGKTRVAAETFEAAISVDESFLGEVIGEGGIAVREVAKETAHGGLMAADECSECRPIIAREHARDEFGIGWSHDRADAGEASDYLREAIASITAPIRRAMPMKPGMQPK